MFYDVRNSTKKLAQMSNYIKNKHRMHDLRNGSRVFVFKILTIFEISIGKIYIKFNNSLLIKNDKKIE